MSEPCSSSALEGAGGRYGGCWGGCNIGGADLHEHLVNQRVHWRRRREADGIAARGDFVGDRAARLEAEV